MEISDRILNAAIALFERLGIRSVSMDDISRQLGMSKKTIYQYFKDKDEIVTCFCSWQRKTHNLRLRQISENSPSALHELVAISQYMKETLRTLNPGLLHELHKYHPNGYSVFQDHKNLDVMPSVVQSIQRGITEGVYRPEINVQILARLRIEEFELAFNPNIFPPQKYSPYEVQKQLMQHFFYGLLTQEGLVKFNELMKTEDFNPITNPA
jgi:AcrR family transcriptional regulator